MIGIRVSGLPADVTDRHLRVYFSNPRNGGGRIQNLYHPLPHASAVILFDDGRGMSLWLNVSEAGLRNEGVLVEPR